MGGTSSKSVQSIDSMSAAFFSAVVKVKQECMADSEASNSLTIEATGALSDTDAAIVKECVKQGRTPAECIGQKGNVTQSGDITQKSKSMVKVGCKVDASQQSDIISQMAQNLEQGSKTSNDSIFGMDSNNNQSQTVKQFLTTVLTTDIMNKAISNAIAKNELVLKTQAGLAAYNVTADVGAYQNSDAKAFSEALAGSENWMKVQNKMDTKTSQENTVKQTMVASACCCCVLVIVIGVVFVMLFKKSPQGQAASAASSAKK